VTRSWTIITLHQLTKRITEIQHGLGDQVRSGMHVDLDAADRNCLAGSRVQNRGGVHVTPHRAFEPSLVSRPPTKLALVRPDGDRAGAISPPHRRVHGHQLVSVAYVFSR
jgi:hypothetical protein